MPMMAITTKSSMSVKAWPISADIRTRKIWPGQRSTAIVASKANRHATGCRPETEEHRDGFFAAARQTRPRSGRCHTVRNWKARERFHLRAGSR